MLAPIHNGEFPATLPALAFGLIVIAFCAELGAPQPAVMVYMILQDPVPTPVTTPLEGFTVAMEVLELLQVPPASPLEA